MIKRFKDYYNKSQQVRELVINDLLKYYSCKFTELVDEKKIKEFLIELFEPGRVVEINCKYCISMKNGVVHYENFDKTHKGVVRGIGYGFDNILKYVITLDLYLKKIKHTHRVRCDLPVKIYGKLPEHLEKVITEIDITNQEKKYNI